MKRVIMLACILLCASITYAQTPQPAATVPAQPAATVPAQPAATVPAQPAATVPTQPAATVPAQPAAAVPAQPAVAVPAQPAATVPAQPAAIVSAKTVAPVPTNNKFSVKRLDVNLNGGTVFYGDRLGYNAMVEGRAYMLKLPWNMDLFAGAGMIYQYTESTLHTVDHWYGYALAGADYGGLKNFFPKYKTLLGPLSLRAQLAIGSGFTTDKNSTGSITEKNGYILFPSIGADYSFGKVHAIFMMGYQIIGVDKAEFTAPAISIGASYTIF